MDVIVVDSTGTTTISKIIKQLELLRYRVSIFKNLTAAACRYPDVIIVVGRGSDHIDQLVHLSKLDNLPKIYWIYNPVFGDIHPGNHVFITKVFNRIVLSYTQDLLFYFKKNTESIVH